VQVTGAIDDLEGELERGLGPGDQLACVPAIGPGQLDVGEGLAQVPQQGLGRVAVLHAGRGDQHGQQQAQDVDGDVPLAAVILSLAFDHGFDLRRCDVDVSLTGRHELPLSTAQ